MPLGIVKERILGGAGQGDDVGQRACFIEGAEFNGAPTVGNAEDIHAWVQVAECVDEVVPTGRVTRDPKGSVRRGVGVVLGEVGPR